ncbi:hypothetical protein K6025_05305 [Ehrlichia sp. JZT12]
MFFSLITQSIKTNVSNFFNHICQAINVHGTTNSSTTSADLRSVLGFNRDSSTITQFCQDMFCTKQIHSDNRFKLAKYWLNLLDIKLKDCIPSWQNSSITNNTPSSIPSVKSCKDFSHITFFTGLVTAFMACIYFYLLSRRIRKEVRSSVLPLRTRRRQTNNVYTFHRMNTQSRPLPRTPEGRTGIPHENTEVEPLYQNVGEEEEHIYEYINIDPNTFINVENCQSIGLSSQYETTRQ